MVIVIGHAGKGLERGRTTGARFGQKALLERAAQAAQTEQPGTGSCFGRAIDLRLGWLVGRTEAGMCH